MNEPIYVASPKEKSRKTFRVTWKGCLSTATIFVGLIIGGIIGLVVGVTLISKGILPSWSKYEIDTENLDIQEILNVHFYYDILERKSSGIVYVKTADGQLHSFSRMSESWQTIEPYEDGIIKKLAFSYGDVIAITDQDKILLLKNNHWELQMDKEKYPVHGESQPCTKERLFPPIWQTLRDTEGAIVDHSLATETFCTILLKNGRLQSWYHQVNAFSVMYILGFSFLAGCFGGLITGFYISKRFIVN